MISLAIPTYNRSDLTIESFKNVLNNNLISEIIILDDYSSVDEFNKLWNATFNLNSINNKIIVYRNSSNLKPLVNKYEVVKKCNNDWVILLDSDNIIDNDYISVISKLNEEEDVLYSPETLFSLNKEIEWNYSEYNNFFVTKQNAKDYISNGSFETMLNTGNFLVNREKYVEVYEQSCINEKLGVNDAAYFSYLWLASGNRIKVVPNLNYIHRIHKGSWYKNNQDSCALATDEIHKKIKLL
jgi:glycosyltransferase involved in cell wall biosynthesis